MSYTTIFNIVISNTETLNTSDSGAAQLIRKIITITITGDYLIVNIAGVSYF